METECIQRMKILYLTSYGYEIFVGHFWNSANGLTFAHLLPQSGGHIGHTKSVTGRKERPKHADTGKWKRNEVTSLEGYKMKMFKIANRFNRDEDGAVTVDWVVLTAAIVGLGIAVLASVRGGTVSLADKISANLSAQEPAA